MKHTIEPETLDQWSRLIESVKPAPSWCLHLYDEPFDDTTFATEEEAEDAAEARSEADGKRYEAAPCSVQLTIGYTPETGRWGYQPGDNSYTGGAYGHPFWGVAYLTHETEVKASVSEIEGEILDQVAEYEPAA